MRSANVDYASRWGEMGIDYYIDGTECRVNISYDVETLEVDAWSIWIPVYQQPDFELTERLEEIEITAIETAARAAVKKRLEEGRI